MSRLISRVRREVVLGSALLFSPLVAFAAEGDIDISKALLYIAGGIVAAGSVGAAMFGLVVLIGSMKKSQRAGT